MKIVICSASKDSNDGNAGYPKVVRLVLSPSEGGDYNLEFALRENAHPEVAFLAVDVDGTYNQGWYSLDFELWGRKPVGRFGKSGGPQPLESKSLGDLAGSGFAIPAASATRDLRVRYRYEGTRPQDFGPPYREVLTIRVGAIKPGTRRHIRLTIPQQ